MDKIPKPERVELAPQKPKQTDRKRVPRCIWATVFPAVVVVIVVDVLSGDQRGGSHWESVPAFFLLWGFVSCLFLVVISKLVDGLLGRSEENVE